KRRAEAAERGDDLIEDQQDVVLGADGGEALQVALRRNEHAGRAGDRLDDDGGDARWVVQDREPLQIVGKLRAVLRLAAAKGVARQVVRVAQMIDARHECAKRLAIGADAANRSAAEVYAVIAALAADKAHL